jgi:hypothetical protein
MELRLDQLRTWVESKEPETVVGYTSSTHTCPLAAYLRHLDPHHSWCICLGRLEERPIHAVYYDTEGNPLERMELPAWARMLVSTVDGRYLITRQTEITAASLLGIINHLPKEPHEAAC